MTPIRKPFDAVLKEVAYYRARPDSRVVVELSRIGRQTIQEAFRTKATGVILGNQIDAYGYGVFFNRELVLQNYLDGPKYRQDHINKAGKWAKGAAPDVKRNKRGRSMAMAAIKSFCPDKDGYVLYVVNSMWYSTIHQAWGLPILGQAIPFAEAEIRRVFDVPVTLQFYNYGY